MRHLPQDVGQGDDERQAARQIRRRRAQRPPQRRERYGDHQGRAEHQQPDLVHQAESKAGGQPGRSGDKAAIDAHYTRALELSKGASAGLFVAYAEAVSLPAQNKPEFRAMLERAIAVDPDRQPRDRLATVVSQRRARWLLGRIDDLILSDDRSTTSGGAR